MGFCPDWAAKLKGCYSEVFGNYIAYTLQKSSERQSGYGDTRLAGLLKLTLILRSLGITHHSRRQISRYSRGMKTATASILVFMTVVRYIRAFIPAIIFGGAIGLLAGCVTETTTRRVSLPTNPKVTTEIATSTKSISVLQTKVDTTEANSATTTTVNDNPPS